MAQVPAPAPHSCHQSCFSARYLPTFSQHACILQDMLPPLWLSKKTYEKRPWKDSSRSEKRSEMTVVTTCLGYDISYHAPLPSLSLRPRKVTSSYSAHQKTRASSTAHLVSTDSLAFPAGWRQGLRDMYHLLYPRMRSVQTRGCTMQYVPYD